MRIHHDTQPRSPLTHHHLQLQLQRNTHIQCDKKLRFGLHRFPKRIMWTKKGNNDNTKSNTHSITTKQWNERVTFDFQQSIFMLHISIRVCVCSHGIPLYWWIWVQNVRMDKRKICKCSRLCWIDGEEIWKRYKLKRNVSCVTIFFGPFSRINK